VTPVLVADASGCHRQLEHGFAWNPDTGEVAGVVLVVWPRDPGRMAERSGKLFST
jgi:hypothetical protein